MAVCQRVKRSELCATYPDPEGNLDPEGGVLVNEKTHQEIHRRKIRDEKALEEYKKEIQQK